MVSSQQMNDVKASSSLHKCQMRPDDTAVRDYEFRISLRTDAVMF